MRIRVTDESLRDERNTYTAEEGDVEERCVGVDELKREQLDNEHVVGTEFVSDDSLQQKKTESDTR